MDEMSSVHTFPIHGNQVVWATAKEEYLGNSSIAGKSISSIAKCRLGGPCWNGDNRPPLGKTSSGLVVLCSPLRKAIKALAP